MRLRNLGQNPPLAICFDSTLQNASHIIQNNPQVAQTVISLQTRVLHRHGEAVLLRDIIAACPNLADLSIMIATQRMLQHVADLFEGQSFQSLLSFRLYAGMIGFSGHDIEAATPQTILGSMPNLRHLSGFVMTEHDDESKSDVREANSAGGLLLETYQAVELSDSSNEFLHSQLAVVATVQNLWITVADQDAAEHLPRRVASVISRSMHHLRSIKVVIGGYIPDYALRLPKALGTALALCTRLQSIELPCRVAQNVSHLFEILELVPPGLLTLTISECVEELLHELPDVIPRMACLRTLRRMNLDGTRSRSDTVAMSRLRTACHTRRIILKIVGRQLRLS